MKKTYLTKQEVKDMVRNLYLKLGDGKNAINLQTSAVRETFKKENFLFGIDVLRREIERLFGSKINLDIELGFKPNQHISTIEEDIEEYREICEKKGGAISVLSLREMGLGRIIGKFYKNNIDKNELDKSLGFKPLCRNKPRTQEEVIEKYRKLYKKNGNRPLNGIQLEASGLVSAIGKLFPSRNEFYKMAGCDIINECWTRDKIIKRFKELCPNRPLFQSELRLLGEHKLDSAIAKHFSSRQDLYSECGYSSDVLYLLSNGELVRSSYEVYLANYLMHNEIDFQCDKIIDKTAGRKFRYDFLVKDIYGNDRYIEIWGFENTRHKDGRKGEYSKKRKIKEKFYKDRNLKLISINEDVFRSSTKGLQERFKNILIEDSIKLDNFKTLNNYDLIFFENNRLDVLKEKYLKICQEKNGGKEPVSIKYLQSIEEGGIVHAIQKYAGGKIAFDESLGFKKMRSKRLSFDEFIEEFNQICQEQGDIPLGPTALKEMGQRGRYIVGLATDYNITFRELNSLCGYKEWDIRENQSRERINQTNTFLKENEDKIVQAYLEEGTCEKAGKVFNVSTTTFNTWLRNLPNHPNPSKRNFLYQKKYLKQN